MSRFQRRSSSFVLVLALSLSGCRFNLNTKTSAGPVGPMSSQIVVLADGVSDPNGMADALCGQTGSEKVHVYQYALQGFSAYMTADTVAALKIDSRVRYILSDTAFKTSAQTIPSGVKRIHADHNVDANIGSGHLVDVAIAILDTGIYTAHSDLNVYVSQNFTTSPFVEDSFGHGTHVAGIAGAIDNSLAVVGVAPGARLWNVKVVDDQGIGLLSDIIAGIDYVTQNAAQIAVANMSFGGPGSDDGNCGRTSHDPLHEAICNSVNSGVVYVAAAGNDARDVSGTVPAAYPEVIAVSAIVDTDGKAGGRGLSTSFGADDTFASFSNFGSRVALAAPGVNILSTWIDGGTMVLSGTSMAAPHVTGAAALYIVKNGKPTSAAGVLAVRRGLIAVASPQNSNDGFSGDPGSEPLVNAGEIDPDNNLIPPVVSPTPTPSGAPTPTPVSPTPTPSPAHTPCPTPPPSPCPTPVVPSIYISSISYQMWNGTDLYVTMGVRNWRGQPVAGAQVMNDLFQNGYFYSGSEGITSGGGYVTFGLPHAGPGCYRVSILDISAPGYIYQPYLNAPDSGYCH